MLGSYRRWPLGISASRRARPCTTPAAALGLSEVRGGGTTSLGRPYRRQPRLAPGRRLYAWFACFVPPALGLFEDREAVRHAWVAYIGANRASLRAGDCMLGLLALFRRPLDFLKEKAVRHAWVAYIGANRASRRAGDCMLGLLALFRRPLDFLK